MAKDLNQFLPKSGDYGKQFSDGDFVNEANNLAVNGWSGLDYVGNYSRKGNYSVGYNWRTEDQFSSNTDVDIRTINGKGYFLGLTMEYWTGAPDGYIEIYIDGTRKYKLRTVQDNLIACAPTGFTTSSTQGIFLPIDKNTPFNNIGAMTDHQKDVIRAVCPVIGIRFESSVVIRFDRYRGGTTNKSKLRTLYVFDSEVT